MKSGWKDMYFGKHTEPTEFEKHHKHYSDLRREKKKFCKSLVGKAVQAAKKANANIGSDAEIAAYLAREPVARRYEYDEPKGEE